MPNVFMAAVLHKDDARSIDNHPSNVVYLSRNRATIDRVMRERGARKVDARQTVGWSDNYADVLSAIWRRYAE